MKAALRRAGWIIGVGLLGVGLAAAPASHVKAAETESEQGLERRVDDLEEKIDQLRRELERLRGSGAGGGVDSATLAELGRRIEVLTRDLERLRIGEAAEVSVDTSKHGFGPAASKIYGTKKGLSVGGYGEMLYQAPASRRDDGSRSNRSETLDFLRAVLYFGYKFNDRILFNSEIEYEHATTGAGDEEEGEVSLEFAYLDFLVHDSFNVRTGLLLAPIGFVNELHEPPVFHGARRPEVETQIIPTTWRDNGVGIFGDFGLWTYRAYVMAPLDGREFNSRNLRSARQNGSRSNVEDLAIAARLDLTGVPGLLAGASIYSGDSGLGSFDGGRLTLADIHVDWKWRGLELRGLVTRAIISDVETINAAHLDSDGNADPLGSDETVGERLFGWYGQIAYDVLSPLGNSDQQLFPFVRYERIDTQHRVPPGFDRNASTDRTVFTGGLTYRPIPNIAIKVDYQNFDNDAGTGTNQYNVAIGYLF